MLLIICSFFCACFCVFSHSFFSFFSATIYRDTGNQRCAPFYLWHCIFAVCRHLLGGHAWRLHGFWRLDLNGAVKPSKINRIYFIWLHGQYQRCRQYVYLPWEKLKVCPVWTFNTESTAITKQAQKQKKRSKKELHRNENTKYARSSHRIKINLSRFHCTRIYSRHGKWNIFK